MQVPPRSSAGATDVPGEQVAGGAVQVAAAAVVAAGPGLSDNGTVVVVKWVAPLIRRGLVSEACEVDGAGGVGVGLAGERI